VPRGQIALGKQAAFGLPFSFRVFPHERDSRPSGEKAIDAVRADDGRGIVHLVRIEHPRAAE
jgi:hypothetical protein